MIQNGLKKRRCTKQQGKRKFKMTEVTGSLNKVWGVGRASSPPAGDILSWFCLGNPERTSKTEACGWVGGGLPQPLWSLGKTLIGLMYLWVIGCRVPPFLLQASPLERSQQATQLLPLPPRFSNCVHRTLPFL